MAAPAEKDLIVVVQCHIAAEHCSGYWCERAFRERSGGFAVYPADRPYRTLTLTCGGCCGRALQRKLLHLARLLKQQESMGKERVVVQLASCITKSNYHAPACPHLGYLRELVARAGLELREDTHISLKAERRRQAGRYSES